MYDIIVGVDTDVERARTQAEAVAALPGRGEINAILVHVFDNEDGDIESVEAVSEARSILEEADVGVTTEGIGGETAMALLDTAERYDADCICVAGRKRSPAGKAIFGSVTQDVIMGTQRPTLVCSREE
ncbi:universal stress protein [Halalkalicoccus jeotgali]|uniref:UspA domain protein n=1 Tax=Halalkalicoccus jeotgali (strain DSM 18796 / CECT 7217 / JCM 14584 / KCTC 4019 / B3) TaxID=795797 RepID=D8J7I7_HALJB|nr:universal stress protein [Halalkalicoccus jeotgali]ADJ16007.1 UspA domain protein [Halalkalicoccus jeotgali B3]ELY38103.1 UspA domain-containing protein [Halalkalicoccus jeotgali B3]